MRAFRGVAVALTSLAVLPLWACAQPSSSGSAAGETGATATTTPTTTRRRPTTPSEPTEPNLPVPSGAPTVPTDPSPKDSVAGRISQVGSGPCYTVANNDGVAYALVGGNGPTLTVGTWVRVTFGPPPAGPASCPGKPVTIVKLEVIG